MKITYLIVLLFFISSCSYQSVRVKAIESPDDKKENVSELYYSKFIDSTIIVIDGITDSVKIRVNNKLLISKNIKAGRKGDDFLNKIYTKSPNSNKDSLTLKLELINQRKRIISKIPKDFPFVYITYYHTIDKYYVWYSNYYANY